MKKERDRDQSQDLQSKFLDEIASTNLKLISPSSSLNSVARWSPHESTVAGSHESAEPLEYSPAASAAGTTSTTPSTPPVTTPPVPFADSTRQSPLKQRERERERQREREREQEREREREREAEIAPLVDLAIEHEPSQQAER